MVDMGFFGPHLVQYPVHISQEFGIWMMWGWGYNMKIGITGILYDASGKTLLCDLTMVV